MDPRDDRYSYRTLRDRLDQIPADVRIAVLDACASGAFTRIKSGKTRPAFLVDEASKTPGLFLDQGTVLSIPVVLRWNPLTTGREHRAIKPFFSLGVVPAVGWGRERFYSGLTFRAEEYRRMAASVHMGAGVDFHLTRKFVLGVDGGYNTMVKGFSRPVGARHTYSAPEFGLTVGWLFGRGRSK